MANWVRQRDETFQTCILLPLLLPLSTSNPLVRSILLSGAKRLSAGEKRMEKRTLSAVCCVPPVRRIRTGTRQSLNSLIYNFVLFLPNKIICLSKNYTPFPRLQTLLNPLPRSLRRGGVERGRGSTLCMQVKVAPADPTGGEGGRVGLGLLLRIFRFIILCCFLLRRTYFSQGKFAPLPSFSLSYFSRAADGSFCASGRGEGEWGIEEQQKRKVGASERLSVHYIRCTKTTIGT